MKHSTPKPNKAALARFDKLYGMGCVACFLWDQTWRYPQIHHLNLDGKAGQKRRGHKFTIPLCEWHHTGRIHNMETGLSMAEKYGPSLAKQSKRFRAVFGSDDELLARINARLEKAA